MGIAAITSHPLLHGRSTVLLLWFFFVVVVVVAASDSLIDTTVKINLHCVTSVQKK